MSRCRPVLFFALLAIAAAAGAQTHPLAELSATDASVKGAITMTAAGTEIMSGSSVTAGESTASLRLTRGGEVRLCPHSVLSLSSSPSGREIMLAMGAGALETHYRLGQAADTILTPDFRLLLAGPGEFNFAISADAHGNTCVRSLPGNTSSIIVSEQMGDGVYQVRPDDQVLFRGGSIVNPELLAPPDCGCPAAPPNLRSANPPPSPPAVHLGIQSHPLPIPPFRPAGPAEGPPTSVSPLADKEVHVQVDAPFVFHGTDTVIPAAPMVARLSLQSLPSLGPPPEALPPPSTGKTQRASRPQKKRGFFGHLRSFFAAVFH